MNSNSSEGERRRRLVVAIGPPKTASTSLQNFLAKYVTIRNNRHAVQAFDEWHYPMFFGRDNGFKELEKGYDDPDYVKIRDLLQRQSPSMNLVLASEYLIRYETWLDGRLWKELSNWTGVAKPEIVLISRSPRTSHLISIWKQLTQVKWKPTYGLSFQELLCNKEVTETMEERLALFANPLGVAHRLISSDNLPTYVIDSGGVAQQDSDICHAFSCSVLKVNCTEDPPWVQGLEGVSIQSNARKGDPELSPNQTIEFERIFQERDCAYFEDLRHNSMFHLFYKFDGLWPEDCAGEVRSVAAYRNNASVMLQELRRIMQCPAYEHRVKDTVSEEKDFVMTILLPNMKVQETVAYFTLVLISVAIWWRPFTKGRKRSNHSVPII